MKLEEKIYSIRKKSGMSQEELADKLDVSRQAVHKWEAGTAQPEIDKIKAIAKLFNVSFDYLMDDEIDTIEEPKKEVKKEFVRRSTYVSKMKLGIGQSDIDNGYLSTRNAKLKSQWLSVRQLKVKKNLASLGISNIMFVPHFSATAFFYDTKKNIMGFYYAGEIQFICPYENIVKFTYGQGTPTTINTRTPITSVGFNSQGINSVGVGSISQQKTLNSTLAYATLTYRTETGEIKTFALDFSVASRYQAQGCKDIDDLNCIQNADMGALLNILNKIDAKIAGFIELGKDIVDGKITPDKFDKTDYIKKNVEFKKEYNIFLSAIEEETKKDNIAHLIGSIIFWGLIIGIAIFLIVFIIQNMDSIEIYY